MPRVFVKRKDGKRGIDEETREASCGPLSLNVSLARAHGYSQKQIDRMFETVSRLAKKESGISTRRFPDRNAKQLGTVIFLGPCCLCDGKGTEKGPGYCHACEGRLKRIEL